MDRRQLGRSLSSCALAQATAAVTWAWQQTAVNCKDYKVLVRLL
jgi:hypothetical protein